MAHLFPFLLVHLKLSFFEGREPLLQSLEATRDGSGHGEKKKERGRRNEQGENNGKAAPGLPAPSEALSLCEGRAFAHTKEPFPTTGNLRSQNTSATLLK